MPDPKSAVSTYADTDGTAIAVSVANPLPISATFSTGDIEIGAVEIKNGTDDTRAAVGAGAAANALRVVTATDDTVHGPTTESAAASPAATAGLNGVLKGLWTAFNSLAGALTETAPASDTASSGLNGRLQRIAQRLTSLIAQFPASLGTSKAATFTPAASSHTAGDCNGAAGTFTAIGSASGAIMITGATLLINGGTAEASAWRLHLYSVTPPSATADDGAWDLPSGDQASYLGQIELGTAVDQGSTQWIETNGINKQILLAASGNLFAYLVNLTTVTPAAVAHTVTLTAVPV